VLLDMESPRLIVRFRLGNIWHMTAFLDTASPLVIARFRLGGIWHMTRTPNAEL
jgi:hypothetical protein